MTPSDAKLACPCCGYRTLSARCDWDVCPVCFWEDDVLAESGRDPRSPANGDMSLSVGQASFAQYGACTEELASSTRPPQPGEERDPAWAPLPPRSKRDQASDR